MADNAKPKIGTTVEKATQHSTYYPESSNRPWNPNELFVKRMGYDLFDEALRDDVVESILEYKKNLILGSNFEVISEDEKITKYWEYVLHEAYEGSFRQAMRKMLSCLEYGFSFTEKVLKPVEVEGKPYWGIRFLKTRPPHGVELVTDDFGNLEKIIQRGSVNYQDVELDPNNFILFTYRPKFSNPYGRSEISEGVYRSVKSKNFLIKFLMIAAERHATPLVLGKVPANTEPTEIQTLHDMLRNLSLKATGVIPDVYGVEFVENNTDLIDRMVKALNYFNLSIARGMLVSDLQGLSGEQMSSGGLGGNLGDVQFTIIMEIFKRIRDELVSLINNQLVYPLTRLNFGPDARADFKINEMTRDERYKSAEMFLKYLEKGGKATLEQKNWLMDIMDAPQISEEEDQPEMPAIPGMPGQNPNNPATGDIEDDIENPDNPPAQGDDDQREKGLTIENAATDTGERPEQSWAEQYNPYRDFTASEKRVDFAELDRETKRISTQHADNVVKTIEGLLGQFYETIRARRIVENKRFEQLRQLKIVGLNDVRKAYKAMLEDGLKNGKQIARAEVGKVSLAAPILEGNIAADPIVQEWINSKMISLTKNVSDATIGLAETVLADAMRTGMGSREAIKALNAALEEKLGKAQLERIVRTNTMAAFNQGRLTEFRDVPGVKAFQWSAILDNRTSEICMRMDGKRFRATELADYPIPAHPNCRSVWVAVFEEDIEGLKPSEVYQPKPSTERRGGFLKLV